MLHGMEGEVSDQELMLRYGAGEADAFGELYARHKGPLYRYFLRQCRNDAVTEELFQETWVRIINARKKYRATAKFTTWMYRIAHNLLMDSGRKSVRQPALVVVNNDEDAIPLPDEGASPGTQSYRMQQQARLMQALDKLPPVQREAFLLKEESGLSLVEIGRILGVGRETVKSRLRYALKKLRAELADERETLL